MDDSWGATQITFLENAFYQRAVQAGRYEVANGKTPSPGSVSEEIQAELDEFIENTHLILGALGITAFQPKASGSKKQASVSTTSSAQTTTEDDEPIFELSSSSDAPWGLGQRTSSGFVVFAGAKLKSEFRPSASKGVRATRERFAEQVRENVLTQDVEFTSPSAAASFLTGGTANGRVMWKLKDNPMTTLADWEEREARLADAETAPAGS